MERCDKITVRGKKAGGGGVREREKTFGVVDIGSNTVHLLVASTNGRTVTPLVDESAGLRLGWDVDSNGGISDDKLEELIATLQGFQATAAEAGVIELHLLATHALRVASNSEEVREAITGATFLQTQVLSAEQEARLAYIGAEAECPSIGPQVVVDIGGGSVQVTVGRDREVWNSVSMPLGAARLALTYLPSDPPASAEKTRLVTYLATVVPPALPCREAIVTGLIGVGGTLRWVPQLLRLNTGQLLPPNMVGHALTLLRGRPADELVSRYNIKPERARLMLPALLVLREVLRGYDAPPLIISSFGMREGAILRLARHGAI
jgi:exopolyphosphatase / guanosine-5'-triphosphate,3'-diphosphate pyrophosphatase